MHTFQGCTALITGGASGIGKIMGRKLLEQGLSTLVIWDVNPLALKITEEEFAHVGTGSVNTYVVDVADLKAIKESSQKVRAHIGRIDFLFNNAGIVVGKLFRDHSHEDIERTMKINSDALMHIALEFLDDMLAAGSGHIINIASAAGMVSNPKMSVYCASKWAVIGWSDSLRIELEQQRTGVHVTTVTPYYIKTGMFEGVQSRFLPLMEPEEAAQKILNGVRKGKIFIRLSPLVASVPFIRGILPQRWFDVIGGKWLGIYRTMDDFVGRKG